MKIDAYNHIFPKAYWDKMTEVLPNGRDMHKRVRSVPSIVDLDARFKIMDEFGDDYTQIISLGAPPIEHYGPPKVTNEMARLANDGMAELCRKYPDRFIGFIASLPLNDIEGTMKETKRAIDDLGALGTQIFTNINGRPVYSKETEPFFDLMAKYDLPVWMHPSRGPNDMPDYKGEKKSHYEIFWTFGWPYETSVAMSHMVFDGLFDKHPDFKLITHHMGGMIPYFEGRVGPGWDQLGSRTSDEDYTVILKRMKAKGKRPIDYFRNFYADTAVFGALEATKCGLKFFGVDHTIFASDAPFDPQGGRQYIRHTLEIINQLDISPFEREAIYAGNIRRMCRMDANKPQ